MNIFIVKLLVIFIFLGSCTFDRPKYKVIIPIDSIYQNKLFEIDVYPNLKTRSDDFKDIEIKCDINTPTNDTIRIEGFYYRPFLIKRIDGIEGYEPDGDPYWKLRYTPREPGAYNIQLTISNKGKKQQLKQVFTVSKFLGSDFITINKDNRVVFSNDSIYIPIGVSVAWTDPDSMVSAYNYYFKKLADHHCNYSRVWLADWNLPIEWTEVNDPTSNGGIGNYSQLASWKLDTILKMAEHYDLYLMLTLGNYGDLKEGTGLWDEYRWDKNPYNIKNGGYCISPEEFFTNPDAIDAYKNKLQFIINRWGYSPNIFAFEIWNEYSCSVDWLKSITDFIKTADPNKHLLTTSTSYNDTNATVIVNDSAIWMLPNIDFTQTHLYGNGRDIKSFTSIVTQISREMRSKYCKPHLLSEIGIDFEKSDLDYDSAGLGTQLQNAAWASLFSGSMGIAISHWKEYIDQRNLYPKFAVISKIISELDIHSIPNETTINIDNITSRNYHSYLIDPEVYWGRNRPDTIFLETDSNVENLVSQFIYSSSKGPYPSFQVFETNYKTNGSFSFSVSEISQNARLILSIDDSVIWSKYFSAEHENDLYTYRYFDTINNVYKAYYTREYIFNIKEGKHHIKLENTGKDWLRISNINFGNYYPSYKSLEIFGLQENNSGIMWVHNEKSNWYNAYRGVPVEPIISPSFCIKGLPQAKYSITAYDAVAGKTLLNYTKNNRSNGLLVKFDTLHRDIFFVIDGL